MVAGFTFELVPTKHTLHLASTRPEWGANANNGTVRGIQVQLMTTRFHITMHAVLHELAHHPSRVQHGGTACVVALPYRTCPNDLNEHCPGRPLLVMEQYTDAELQLSKRPLCPTLWGCDADRRLILLTASRPLFFRKSCMRSASVDGVLMVPYMSHVRSAAIAAAALPRTVRVAYFASAYGHGAARKNGFDKWRRALGTACDKIEKNATAELAAAASELGETTACGYGWPVMNGRNAADAVELYAASVFCLMPPGDTIVRGAIADALSVGCIPVFLHPAQQHIWPSHWDGKRASVLFDWSAWMDDKMGNATSQLRLSSRESSRKTLSSRMLAGGRREGGATKSLGVSVGAPRPTGNWSPSMGTSMGVDVFRGLLRVPAHHVRELQRAVADAAPRVIYRGDRLPTDTMSSPDAVDMLVRAFDAHASAQQLSSKIAERD